MIHKELQYRTFDELLDAVKLDMELQDAEGFIQPMALMKVARFINSKLSTKINPVRETVLEISHYRTKLPDNFHLMNFALLCFSGSKTVVNFKPTTEEVVTEGCYPTDKPYTRYDDCGNGIQVIQHFSTHTYTWREQAPIHFTDGTLVKNECPNRRCRSAFTAYIKDGYIWTNVEYGNLYINYEASMEDEEGNLLVVDHDIINGWYEYALKDKILENMFNRGEQVQTQLQLNRMRLREAKIEATAVNRMPDFYELLDYKEKRRKAIYAKYFNMYL